MYIYFSGMATTRQTVRNTLERQQSTPHSNALTPTWWRVSLFIILLLAFALRLHTLTHQDIWWDEARNIDVALRPFGHIATAPELDIHPPVYFWLLHVWGRMAGLGVEAVGAVSPAVLAFLMRFVSVGAGMLSVALIALLARSCAARQTQNSASLCAAIIASLSPFWLAESQEARMYTVGFALLGAAGVAILDCGLRIEDSSIYGAIRQRKSFILLSALAFLVHYNALFILVAWYGWWGVYALMQQDRWRRISIIIGCGLATLLLVLPVAPIALRQIPTYANPNLVIPTLADYLTTNWQSYLGGYAWTTELLSGWATVWLWAMLAVLVIGMTLYFGYWILDFGLSARPSDWQNPKSKIANLESLFLLTWLCGGLLLYYIAVLDRGTFNPRYASFITPALYALLGLALAQFGRICRPLTVLGLVLVLVGLIPAVRADLYDGRFDREHVSDVVDWLRIHTRPDDVIFVDQKYPFGFYYDRYTILADATPEGDEAAPARYLFVDINDLDARLTAWAGHARRVFWVQWFESDTDPRRAVAFLLDKAGRRAGEKEFVGYEIDWWELTPPTIFALAPNLTPITHSFPLAVKTVAVSLPAAPLTPGSMIPVVIQWQRVDEGEINRPLKARVALHRMGGSSIKGQADERLLNDRHRLPSEWSREEQPFNVYRVPVPEDLEEGSYEVRLVVYDAETLEALPLVDEAGNPAGMEAVLGMVEIKQ